MNFYKFIFGDFYALGIELGKITFILDPPLIVASFQQVVDWLYGMLIKRGLML